jgi:molybdopterin-containing oxidoreductase family iron-sulfur binding subunit
VAWLGQYRTGSLAAALDLLGESAGLRRVHWEALGVETLLAASKLAYGIDALPTFELGGARTIVSFGYDFLGTAFDSMRMSKGWSRAKNPAIDGFVTRFVAIEPRVGVTSSQADYWYAPAPGTEATVAFALAKLCAETTHYAGPALPLLGGVDVAAASATSGIAEEKLRQVAAWLCEGPSVVLPGGHGNAGTDATALAAATLLINEVCGNVGRGVVYGTESKPGAVHSYADVKSLVEDCKAGRVGVLFLDGANPVYNLPAEDGAKAALEAVDLLVHFANEADDSTVPKAMVLPPGTASETWGDAHVTAGVHVIQQPAMRPLKDTRGVGDTVLAVARALNPAAPAGDFAAFVKARWESSVRPADSTEPFATWWDAALRRGGSFQQVPPTGATWVATALPAVAAPATGSDMALVVFPSNLLGDGRHANIPWAQEVPDPISTYTWTTWAELHPSVVAKLGLQEDDVVEVKTAAGSIRCAYYESKGVRADSVAVVLGNGHVGMGRFATGRGANAMSLLAPARDEHSGALANNTARATVSRVPGSSGALPMSGHPDQDGRQLANAVSPEDAVAHLEGEPASIVGLHHIPMDPRLVEKGITDFYPEPQHPTYRFAMVIDTNACNGCGACATACALENNTPFVGPDQQRKGRSMSWIRVNRFWEGEGEQPDLRHMPAICQHCAHAPCEGVCPVLATYHNLDGLNAMIYNRCVGTRYCANNCPYAARRFNFHTWTWPESYHLMLNPDLSTREMGVMEKCTFCIQRLRAAKDAYREAKETVPDAALRKLTACAAACPTEAITFGNWKDLEGAARKLGDSPRAYTLLGELNTKPGVRYMAKVRHGMAARAGVGAGHGAAGVESEAGATGGQGHAPAQGAEHGKEG